jgi:putative transposase
MGRVRIHRVRHNIQGHARYLTFSCFQNRRFLASERTCGWLAETINAARQEIPFDLWAYVFMPEHCHLLIFPHDPASISRILYGMKKPLADRAVAWVRANAPGSLHLMRDAQPSGKLTHRFRQRNGGYDRNVFSAREVHEKIRYIHNNPVVAGLVQEHGLWRWSSFKAWEEGIDEPIPLDRDLVPPLIL